MWMESAGEDQKPPARRRPMRAAVKRKSIDSKTEDMTKRKRTFEDFFNFCNFVLAYEQQLATTNGLIGTNSAGESSPSTSSPSPSHSSTSTNTSESLEGSTLSAGEEEEREARGVEDNEMTLGPLSPASQNTRDEKLEYTSDDESWNLVTCFCHRPFAGRPMIECSECQTWVHLFCAKIKKNEVPEVYVCPKCRAASARKAKRRKSKTKHTGNAPSS